MEFNELLYNYIKELEITSKELSQVCGISSASMSRYLNGMRVPSPDSEIIQKLTDGIIALSDEKALGLNEEQVKAEIIRSVSEPKFSMEYLVDNINLMIEHFNLKVTKLAAHLNYTSSHFSNIRMHRRPIRNPELDARLVAEFIVEHSKSGENADKLAHLTHHSLHPADSLERLLKMKPSALREYVFDMLSEGDAPSFESFLRNTEIEVEEYVYSDVLTGVEHYFGADGLTDGRVKFFSYNRLLTKGERLFIFDYNSYPSPEQTEARKKLGSIQLSINTLLRKGAVIDRITLPSQSVKYWEDFFTYWLPLAFCGEVNFYKLKSAQYSFCNEILLLSDKSIMVGHSFPEKPELGHVILSKSKESNAFHQKEAEYILSCCEPMIETVLNTSFFNATEIARKKYVAGMFATMADNAVLAFAAPQEFVDRVIERVQIPPESEKCIKEHIRFLRNVFDHHDTRGQLTICVTKFGDEDEGYPLPFYTDEFGYNGYWLKEEYEEACGYVEEYLSRFPNVTLRYVRPSVFSHLGFVFTDNWVVIARDLPKTKSLIIHDETMVRAIKNLVIGEEETI